MDVCALNDELAGMRMKQLQNICTQSLLFPPSYWITGVVKGKRIAAGAEATVYQGVYQGTDVAIREFHYFMGGSRRASVRPTTYEVVEG